MRKLFVFIATLIRWTWKLLTTGSTLLVNLLFLFSILFILSLFAEEEITIPDKAALIIAPAGNIVEKSTMIDPISHVVNGFIGLPLPKETLLQDILDVISAAEQDERIELIVLSLADLEYAGLNQLRTIGRRIERFKASGKKVIAIDDYYSQSKYYLASFADEILLNPMGGVHLRGFGVFRLYMKELIDKLAINFHVFKVGAFKSAVEPFTRNNMSNEAREANADWLIRIWDLFCADIAQNRGFEATAINNYINDMPRLLRQAEGSNSKMALAANLVDDLKTRAEITDHLISLVGRSDDENSFNQVNFNDYLPTITPSFTKPEDSKDSIGIIIARGNIMQGEDIPGQISSETLGRLIRQAQEDENVKALVLRIDSGGGSAFASEQIRQELLLLQNKNKPLIVSMGTLAASGAYWVSAGAEQIIASPFTLTGSIGIFGIVPTFEGSIAKIGITSDGTGTTKLAGAEDPTRPLSPELRETIQLSVEEGYGRFVNIVAEGRDMTHEEAIDLARGKIWDGARAQELGLVDKIGDLEEAISTAAELAGLGEFTPVYIQEHTSSGEKLLQKLGNWSAALSKHHAATYFPQIAVLRNRLPFLSFSGDPANIYAHCLISHSAIAF